MTGTAPNLVVAGYPEVARKLRGSGWFPAVFDVAAASELRELSKSGKVVPPAAFLFGPQFAEDLPGAGVDVVANGLARGGFTVVVHEFFGERGDVFGPDVVVAARQIRMWELLAALGGVQPEAPPEPRPASLAPPDPRPEPPARAVTPQAVNPAGMAAPAPVSVRRGRVIAVAAAKGGVGKTSTAVNLAVFAARLLQAAGRAGTAVLVDTNFQQADVARYLGLGPPTILDLLQAPGALSADRVRHHLAHIPQIGLHALLGPPDAVSADPAKLDSVLYRRILTVLRGAFDFVFVDTPVADLQRTTFVDLILPEADAILVPVEPDRVTLEAAHSWLSAITTPRQVPPEKIFMILNRARSDVRCGPKEVADLLPGRRFAGVIPEDQGWMRAVNTHRLLELRVGPDLEATFRGILQAVSGDPVLGAVTTPPAGRWKKLPGLRTER